MERIVAYPAILDNRGNDDGVYTVTFPDVPGAISEGKSLPAAMQNAAEALGLALYDEKLLPQVSDLKKVELSNKQCIVTLISVNLTQFAKTVKKPTVKKNTTIPGDLAQEAEKAGINFSKTLTDALKKKLQEQV